MHRIETASELINSELIACLDDVTDPRVTGSLIVAQNALRVALETPSLEAPAEAAPIADEGVGFEHFSLSKTMRQTLRDSGGLIAALVCLSFFSDSSAPHRALPTAANSLPHQQAQNIAHGEQNARIPHVTLQANYVPHPRQRTRHIRHRERDGKTFHDIWQIDFLPHFREKTWYVEHRERD